MAILSPKPLQAFRLLFDLDGNERLSIGVLHLIDRRQFGYLNALERAIYAANGALIRTCFDGWEIKADACSSAIVREEGPDGWSPAASLRLP
jgi:hypothetical protein